MNRIQFSKVVLIIFLIIETIVAQEPYWNNYNNGNCVTTIKNYENYLLIGTTGGLVKLNKINDSITFFNKCNSGLPDNNVNCVTVDLQGNIWIATGKYEESGGGLAKFDGENWVVYDPSNSILSDYYIQTVAIDQ